MYSITVKSNTVILPEEIAKTLIGKTVTPVITKEGVLLKNTENDVISAARGMFTNPALSVDNFIARKKEEKSLEQ